MSHGKGLELAKPRLAQEDIVGYPARVAMPSGSAKLAQDGLVAGTRLGLAQMAKSLARETAAQSLTVNSVGVGLTDEFLAQHYGQNGKIVTGGECMQKLQQQLPSAKVSDTNEIAEVVVFLASGLSNAINGEYLRAAHGI